MVGARFGARLTGAFSGVQLARAFAAFQIAVAPLVPVKAELVRRSKAAAAPRNADEQLHQAGGDIDGGCNGSPTTTRVEQLMPLAGIGLLAGIASGMFGVGGGVVVTPALCMLTELPYATVLGTTLASMVPSALVSVATHRRLGNLIPQAVLPLCVGSALGAFFGGQLALRVPEEPLQILFSVVLLGMGGHKLFSLRGR